MIQNNLVKIDVNGIINTAHDNSIKIENIGVKVEIGNLIPKLLGSSWGRPWAHLTTEGKPSVSFLQDIL